MTGGVDVGYDTAAVREAGASAAGVAAAAGETAGRIGGIGIDAAGFGRVGPAAALAAELTAFRDRSADLCRRMRAAHVELASRAERVARDGDRLVVDTAAQARSAEPDPLRPSRP